MRLNPGVSLDRAELVLTNVETIWLNARGSRDLYLAFTDAVHDTFPLLREVFASPDAAGRMRSAAYWNLLSASEQPAWAVRRANTRAVQVEIEDQIAALGSVRGEFEALKGLAARPGLPVVYDTNLLNHWHSPDAVLWRDVFRDLGETVKHVRLVVPIRVIDELDRQKYGQGDLARKAATAIRFMERTLKGANAGQPVPLRDGVTLEVWLNNDDRDVEVDLSVLNCATDLANLCGNTWVVTDDAGMRLRAQNMGLKTASLPEQYRKPGTAIGGIPPAAN